MIQNKDVLVTIGIPFYNAEKYLELVILSVFNQTYKNWELILLDDGSTDNSLNIAKSFNNIRIKVVADGVNKGLIYRLNQLTNMANGEYYARMDADDIMHTERIYKQLNYLLEHPEVDVVGTSYYSIDTSNQIIGKTIVNNKPYSVSSVLKGGCFAHPTIMGKTEWFRKNPYDVGMTRMEDFELWVRTVNTSRFENIPEPLFFYRNVGLPTLKKYYKSNLGIIKLLLNRRKYNIGFFSSIYYSMIYFFKILIYTSFFCFGKMNYLIKKRSIIIDVSEMDIASKEMFKSVSQ